jgi:hypothetical protein
MTSTGWPLDAPALLAALAADNTRATYDRLHPRFAAAVLDPTRALAAALGEEFGPVRVFRPAANRRFRPDAPPYRTDTGGLARSPGGTVRAFVLTATALTATTGHWRFDPGQLRRYRAAVGPDLAALLAGLPDLALDDGHPLVRVPRGVPADHPQADLLRRRGLQAVRTWPVGPWLVTGAPLERVRAAWRDAAPLAAWLDERVGPPDPVAPRPRPAAVAAAGAPQGAGTAPSTY